MRKALLMTAAAVVAVIFFLLATLPAGPRTVAWAGPADLARRTVGLAYHVHTTRSDGAGDRAAVAAAAARAGLNVVIVTDHGDGTREPDAPAYLQGVLCIDGVEISTDGGHYVALGMARAPYPLGGEPAAVVEDVARLAGFGVVAHPESARPGLVWTDWGVPFDGLEWLSADTEWRNEPRMRLTRVLFDYVWRPGPALASILDRPVSTLARWDSLAAQRPVVALAGHDAHGGIGASTQEGQRFAVAGVPSYDASFRSFSERVVLDAPLSGDAQTDARAVLAAVRQGRAFTAIDAIAGPAVLDFHATSERAIVPMGSTVEPGPAAFHAEAAMPSNARMVLLRNGQEVQSADGGPLHVEQALAQGAYRVEIRVPGAPGTPPVPWVVSNPIYFLAHPAVAEPAAIAAVTPLPADVPWHIEKDPSSTGTAAASAAEVRVDYTLGAGGRASQFVALVADLEGHRTGFRSVRFTAVADRPVRASVQLRYPGGGGARWRKSFYADATPREVGVDLQDMVGAEGQTGAAPDSSSATALLFVVDLTNARPGSANSIRFTNIGVGR